MAEARNYENDTIAIYFRDPEMNYGNSSPENYATFINRLCVCARARARVCVKCEI
jgi:hypothetical protein